MTRPDARTPTDLASRSLALHVLTDELAERAGREPACYRLPYRSRGVPNLELCSSCEWGSHHLCVARLEVPGGWKPAGGCKCLCRHATWTDEAEERATRDLRPYNPRFVQDMEY